MSSQSNSPDPVRFLGSCEVVDCQHGEIRQLAEQLAGPDLIATAKLCFEFVRDEISHSSDHQLNPVTCTASDVLRHRTGYCYAKSHLLCALLRSSGIPAGLCYQRLSIDGNGPPYCLHGLCAIHLPGDGWYRVDPRGNRDDIGADFCPPIERLAFATDLPHEQDLPGIHVRPLAVVVNCLTKHSTWDQVAKNLPDVDGG